VSRRSCSTWATVNQWCACTACRRRRSFIASSLPNWPARGLRGIAFDLPGLGLAERPAAFDYTWTGLGRFASAAVEALDLDRFHLVVHDIGAPVGFELAAAHPGRVASLTVLNAPVEVDTFHRPWVMKPFAVKGLGEAYLRLLNPPTFRWLMRHQGVADLSKITTAELDAYLVLLRRTDNGRAFLKIMRGFELNRAKRDLYVGLLRSRAFPVQIVCGRRTRPSRSPLSVSSLAEPPA
jgi:haloalkane dehalogenase